MEKVDILKLIVSMVGYFIIFMTADIGRPHEYKFTAFSKEGILQMVLVIIAVQLILLSA